MLVINCSKAIFYSMLISQTARYTLMYYIIHYILYKVNPGPAEPGYTLPL